MDGKKDPTAVQAYKNVVALRTGFEKLVQCVADTGRTKNELLDVQSRIESIGWFAFVLTSLFTRRPTFRFRRVCRVSQQ